MNRRCLLALASLPLASPSRAAALEAPNWPQVLSVIGRVCEPNRGAAAPSDMAMLAQLPQASFSTRTPWYAQARKFTGPLLHDVLASADSRGRLLRAMALNVYFSRGAWQLKSIEVQ